MQCATLTLQFAQRNSCTLRNRSRSTGISGHDRRNTHRVVGTPVTAASSGAQASNLPNPKLYDVGEIQFIASWSKSRLQPQFGYLGKRLRICIK